MTSVAAALRSAAEILASTSDTARLDAELLMANALGMSRSDMLLHGTELAAPDSFAGFVARRSHHEPVAYIVGVQEFYGRAFRVSADVLIPRSDSETIVAAALARCGKTARILDLGTGSGALLLTLLAEKAGTSGIGIDASLAAASIAASNAAHLEVADRAQILHRDWTCAGWQEGLGQFDLIVANPPYVETTVKLEASVAAFEPAAALFAGAEGLDDYRIIVPQLRGLLACGGFCVVEIGYQQADAVSALAGDCGFAVELFRDLAHRPRALMLR
ncbi:peptide chain release factor N(5)-glutamine methyltransferase [Pontixanthobacter sp.]|uniref:peptide chain release factor N(5)-glutamine methyltransferase n=1 Tax=Pontixanthobacter sp. TaxID=2792078 RepID=UPI003C7BC8BE